MVVLILQSDVCRQTCICMNSHLGEVLEAAGLGKRWVQKQRVNCGILPSMAGVPTID